MKTNVTEIQGAWSKGIVLDKHTLSSVCTGYNEYGHPIFDTTRSEVGESLFQLKYRNNWSKIKPLAQAIADSLINLPQFSFIVPMPPSNPRTKQPVSELAIALGKILDIPVFNNLLQKTHNGQSLKDLATRAEKDAALKDSFSIRDEIRNQGKWDVLLIDDLYHTGASMEAACNALKLYNKVNNVYVAALTWR